MPEFQANIKVEALEGASLQKIDDKIAKWQAGITSTITFNDAGLKEIENRIKALSKINIGGGTGGGGGSRGGSGKISTAGLTRSLSSEIKQYNSLRSAVLKSGGEEAKVLNKELGTLRSSIKTGLSGVTDDAKRAAAGAALRQGTFNVERTKAALVDKANAKAEREALKVQNERFASYKEEQRAVNALMRDQAKYQKGSAA